MSRGSSRIAQGVGVLACLIAVCASAQTPGQKVYRYTDADGRTIYSDHAPPPSARNVQIKKLGQNLIETEAPLTQRIAQERYPVTLYTFDCGDLCQRGEALLNRRGVPFTTIVVSKPDGAERLKRLTGEVEAPVLQVGEKLIAKGFNEPVWQDLLTEAGYPKTPPPRRTTPLQKPPAEVPKAEPKVEAKAKAVPPPSSGGYPQ